jgi:hypothetical protein
MERAKQISPTENVLQLWNHSDFEKMAPLITSESCEQVANMQNHRSSNFITKGGANISYFSSIDWAKNCEKIQQLTNAML